MARSREFKEAMRQRIRDIAVSRDLSDKEIKPALSLKHYKLVRFVEKHGVNWQWLLEGIGRISTNDPINLGVNSSGSEVAAVVATMSMADQRAIRALVREIVHERDQRSAGADRFGGVTGSGSPRMRDDEAVTGSQQLRDTDEASRTVWLTPRTK